MALYETELSLQFRCDSDFGGSPFAEYFIFSRQLHNYCDTSTRKMRQFDSSTCDDACMSLF